MNGIIHIDDLPGKIAEITPDSIISRTIARADQAKAVLFGFDAGQELSEHTSSRAAILEIVSGEASITLGAETVEAKPGTWIYMPPGLSHSVSARTPLKMLLVLIG